MSRRLFTSTTTTVAAYRPLVVGAAPRPAAAPAAAAAAAGGRIPGRRRGYAAPSPHSSDAREKYHFPESTTEALGASQLFKISAVLEEDHRQLETYYRRIRDARDADERTRFQNAFVWELTRHAIGEELVVYPAMERNLPDGKALADHDREEHQTVKNKLYEFQKLSPSSADFMPTLDGLMEDLRHHIRDEEGRDLVRLEEALSASESKELSASFQRTKKFTPTRSHPGAPDRPPFETVAGLMAAPLDKLRDLFARFPKEEEKDGGAPRDPTKS